MRSVSTIVSRRWVTFISRPNTTRAARSAPRSSQVQPKKCFGKPSATIFKRIRTKIFCLSSKVVYYDAQQNQRHSNHFNQAGAIVNPNPSLRFSILLALALFSSWAARTNAAERQIVQGHIPAAAKGLQPLGRLPAQQRLDLVLGLPLRDPQGLTNLLAQLYDPLHPNYHRYLTPEQFAERFGPTQKDYDAAIAFAKSHGLTVAGTHPNRTLLDVNGPVAEIEKAFHVNMRFYQHPTEPRTFHAPDVEPSVDLGIRLLAIGGLENFDLPRPMGFRARPFDSSGGTPYATGSGPRATFIGKDFRAAYAPGVSLDGTGESLGLFEMDGYYPNDITSYESQAGLPNVPLTNVLLNGFSGAPGGNNEEVALDIDMAISMAPGLTSLIVYEGLIGNDILNRMATDNRARQLSSSWGFGPLVDPIRRQIFQQFAAQGQSMFQASGDLGAWVGPITAPSDDPFITVVGGTVLTTASTGGAWVSETTWPSSGGGISTTNPIPNYQMGISMASNQGSLTKRNIPDVACVADSLWMVANNGEFLISGGTSAAAPLWAGFAALANQQAAATGQPGIGFVNPALYAMGKELGYAFKFHDITTGNNTNGSSANKFQAVPGFDLCTGWGTPNGSNLISALLAPPNALRITPGAGVAFSGPAGGPFNPAAQAYTLTNAGTLPINWSLVNTSSWLNVAPATGSLSPGGPATTVSAGLTAAASSLLAGSYNATIVFTNLSDQSVQSRSFTLAVVTPPVITSQPASQVAMEGATASFSVGTSGNALLFYQWRQDNGAYLTNLSNAGNISGATSSTLTISNVSSSNVGAYSVLVSNAAGSVISSNAFLTLLPWRPTITAQPASVVAFLGDTATFQISAVGSQPLFYRWQKAAANLFDGGNISGAATSSLSIDNVSAADAANYTVVITNSLGSATSAVAALTVNSLTAPGITLSRLYAFTGDADGGRPNALTQGRDGNFYATTQNGGTNNDGTAFRLSAAGLFTSLCSFDGTNSGATPYSPLLQWSDGNFYGTAFRGGAFDNGSVFQLTTNGGLTGLVSLNITNGDFPYSGLAQGPDGNLYGTTYKGGGPGAGTVFRLGTNGSLTTIYPFSGGTDGNFPYAGLTLAGDGSFYATTYKGGANAYGAVFKITTNGILFPLASFNNTNGSFPYAGLTPGGDGNFYGASSSGGSFTNGTLFRVTPAGLLTNLYSFTGGNDGANPVASLLAANDGNFYGTTANGGLYGAGTLFRLAPNGSFVTLAQFDGFLGANPIAPMIQATNGILYGATQNGGPDGQGTIFQVGISGPLQITSQPVSQFVYGGSTVFLSVSVSGSQPISYQWKMQGTNLVDGGNVSGSTNRVLIITNVTPANAGVYSVGVTNPLSGLQSADAILSVTVSPPVITLQPTNQTLSPGATATFAVSAIGNLPLTYQWQTNGVNLNDGFNVSGSRSSTLTVSSVTEARNATYSVLVSNSLGSVPSTGAVLTVIPPSAPGTTVTALHWFTTNGIDGDTPNGLAQGSNGNLYGTTQFGGLNQILGSVFSLSTNGTLITLASFAGTNGSRPQATVLQAADGNLYGSTVSGGMDGVGTSFKLTTNGFLTTLYSFVGSSDNINPYAALVQGADSNFYGAGVNQFTSNGTVFRMTLAGTVTNIYSFTGGADGTSAAGALLPLPDGNFYGLSGGGGASGRGNVFRISPGGTLTTIYSFSGGSDGYAPAGALVRGSDGALYGVTTHNVFAGFQFYGTIFRVTTNGALGTLYTLNPVFGDGLYPSAGLLQASDGNLYGTTEFGGASGNGTVFRITPGGAFAKLVNLDGIDLGAHPRAALVEGPDGALYGTANSGGPGGRGTIFRLSFTSAPQITGQPANVAVLPGGNASFSVAVFGAPALLYRWQKNGTNLNDTGNLSGSATRILTLTNVSPADAGTYAVSVTNTLGFTTSAGATLTIVPVPMFQSVIKSNTTFRFTWSAAAGQKYQVQYRTNLVLGNWSNLGGTINATGSLATSSDLIGTNRQRFYRVFLLP
jgi:uncharacterized repeat protein (TIGR03803 family)